MKTKDFLSQLSDDAITTAIQAAEAKTSGEIRVFISHNPVDDPIVSAQRHFERLNMHQTQDRNAVLIFVAPTSHKFAIIGDAGVHARCGESFWAQVAVEMSEHFKRSAWTDGIVHAIKKAGDLLARHFPRKVDDANELSDKVERD